MSWLPFFALGRVTRQLNLTAEPATSLQNPQPEILARIELPDLPAAVVLLDDIVPDAPPAPIVTAAQPEPPVLTCFLASGQGTPLTSTAEPVQDLTAELLQEDLP